MGNTAPCVGVDSEWRSDGRSGEGDMSSPDGPAKPDFTTFYTTELAPLYRYARRQAGDDQAAEDIVADAMMLILTRWDDLAPWLREAGGHARLRSYAFGVVRNFARDLYRRANRYSLVAESDGFNELAADSAESRVEMMDVKRILAQLPDRQSRVLWMEMLGFSMTEIARSLRVRESTARTHLASARRHMRHALDTMA